MKDVLDKVPPGCRPWLPAALLLLAAAVFFWPFLAQGKIFLAADALYHFYPWRAYAGPGFHAHNMLITDPVNHNYAEIYNRQLKEGGLKYWNPYIMTGIPATGATAQSGMSGRYYPLKLLLHRFLKTYNAHDMLLFLHTILMGLSMYAYLMEIGAGTRGALFGGLAWMFNGTAMVWLEFESVTAASAFFPLVFLAMERYLGHRRWLHACLGAVFLGLIALMGHTQFLIYTALMMCFYLVFILWRASGGGRHRRGLLTVLGCFGVTCAGGAMLAAVEMLPVAELLTQSGRIGRAFAFGEYFDTLGRVPFRYLVTLVFPDYFGSPILGPSILPAIPSQEYMNYCELTLFMGVPTVFAFLAALASPVSRHARYYIFVTVLIALMMAGTFVYYPFFKLFPGMNKMNPTRIVWLFIFAFISASALGLKNLEGLTRRGRLVFAGLAAALLGTVLFLAFASARPGLITFFNRELFIYNRGDVDFFAGILTQMRRPDSPVMLKPLLVTLAAGALFLLYAFFPRGRYSPAAFGGIVALLAWEMIAFGRGYNTVVESKYVYPRTPAIDFLLRQPQPFRVLQDARGGLFVNGLGPFRLEEVGGYSSFYPGRINKLMSMIQYGDAYFRRGAAFDRWVSFSNLNSPLFDLLNAKYFVTAPTAELSNPKLKLLFREDLAVYENTRVMDRAFAVHRAVFQPGADAAVAYMAGPQFDMRGEVVLEEEPDRAFAEGAARPSRPPRVTVESHQPDRVVVSADMSANGWLVLTDTWYPGWRAEVNGRSAGILKADGNFRAVALPAGASKVVFAYRPFGVLLGMLLTALGAVCLAAWIFRQAVFDRRRGGGPSGGDERA